MLCSNWIGSYLFFIIIISTKGGFKFVFVELEFSTQHQIVNKWKMTAPAIVAHIDTATGSVVSRNPRWGNTNPQFRSVPAESVQNCGFPVKENQRMWRPCFRRSRQRHVGLSQNQMINHSRTVGTNSQQDGNDDIGSVHTEYYKWSADHSCSSSKSSTEVAHREVHHVVLCVDSSAVLKDLAIGDAAKVAGVCVVATRFNTGARSMWRRKEADVAIATTTASVDWSNESIHTILILWLLLLLDYTIPYHSIRDVIQWILAKYSARTTVQ